MWPRADEWVSPELLHTREWLHEMFREAGKGLPWPYQMSLSMIEQAIMLGMFGSLLSTAWTLRELQRRNGPAAAPGLPPNLMDLSALLSHLEASVREPLPDQVNAAMRHVQSYVEGTPIERTVNRLLAPWQNVFPGQSPWF